MGDMTGEIVEENLDEKVSEASVFAVEIFGELSEEGWPSAQIPDDDVLQGSM